MAAVSPVLLTLTVQAGRGDTGDIGGVLLGAAAFAGPLLIVHAANPGAMGFGDVKLAAVLGAALGLVDWRACLLALCLASAVTACVAIVRRRSSMPFAPGLVGGAALALLPTATEGLLPWR
jgi:leader peptidase (prepilin peptidase)/N-methyltransferase